MRLDDGPDVSGQRRIDLLAAFLAFGGEVLDATDAPGRLAEPLADRVASPAEAFLGLAGVAAAQLGGDLRLEESALMPLQTLGRRTDQAQIRLRSSVH